jgi:hypothetical protein
VAAQLVASRAVLNSTELVSYLVGALFIGVLDTVRSVSQKYYNGVPWQLVRHTHHGSSSPSSVR